MELVAAVFSVRRGVDESYRYAKLSWLSQRQQQIKDRLFATRRDQRKPQLFLYDMTRSYREGEANAYGEYGSSCDRLRIPNNVGWTNFAGIAYAAKNISSSLTLWQAAPLRNRPGSKDGRRRIFRRVLHCPLRWWIQ